MVGSMFKNEMVKKAFLNELNKQAQISSLLKLLPYATKLKYMRWIRGSGFIPNITKQMITRGTARVPIRQYYYLGLKHPGQRAPIKTFVGRTLGKLYNVGQAARRAPAGTSLYGKLKRTIGQGVRNVQYRIDKGGEIVEKNLIGKVVKRSPVGMIGRAAFTAPVLGAMDIAGTPGSIKQKLKAGVKTTAGWGLFRTPYLTKLTLIDTPKSIFKTIKGTS